MSEEIRGAAQQILSLSQQIDREPTKRRKLAVLNTMLDHVSIIESSLGKKGEVGVGGAERRALVKELGIERGHLREALRETEQQTYNGSVYGKIANLFFEPVSRFIARLFPKATTWFANVLRGAGIRVLSTSYLSIVIFTSFVLLFVGTAIGVVVYSLYDFMWGLLLGVALALLAQSVFLLYPIRLRQSRRHAQDRELAFIVTHLAAVANGGAKNVALFRALAQSHHFPYLNTEIHTVVNMVTVVGKSLPEALRDSAIDVPSKRLREFFLELARVMDSRADVREFLNQKSGELLRESQRRIGGIRKYKNTYSDVRWQLFHLRFHWSSAVGVLLAIGLLVVAFGYVATTLWFVPLLVVAAAVGWAPWVVRLATAYRRNKKLETQFFYLAQDLKRTRNPTRLQRQYQDLDPYVQKLMNQYRIGIPVEQAMMTFARDTDNPLIQSLVATVVESKKHGANFYDTLEQVTTSAILGNVLKTD